MGIIGIVIIVFFTGIALLAPYIAPVSPSQPLVAGYWAVPSWATIFPQYSNLPPNTEALNPSMSNWKIHGLEAQMSSQIVNANVPVSPKSRYSSAESSDNALLVNATVPSSLFPTFVPVVNLTQTFTYSYQPPYNFLFGLSNLPLRVSNVTDYYYEMSLTRPDGHVYQLTSYRIMSSSSTEIISFRNGFHVGRWGFSDLSTTDPDVISSSFQTLSVIANPGLIMLNETGTYSFSIELVAVSSSTTGHLSVEIANPYLFIYGRQYGLLGTDDKGQDLWSQFAFGSRISIEVGLVASLITVAAGTLIGLIAGIYTGITDEILMRLADVVLTVPFVPLAIVVIFILVQSPALVHQLYFWLIVLFAVLSWPGLARIIRAQTLSIKERGFVESAIAMGGSRLYIVRKHLLPNVMGLVYATLALSVPGFILTEAALDFLLPGSSQIPTWGRMVSLAYDSASSASFYGFGWWWFIFPGLAIVLLSLAFVLLGYALDSTFNPKLRKR
jgi:peptide/nickel transport system permease protein